MCNNLFIVKDVGSGLPIFQEMKLMYKALDNKQEK